MYVRARYYDPAVGRFASEDPAFHGRNWYVYVSNNPINRIDRKGTIDGVLASLEEDVDWSLMSEKIACAGLASILVVIAGYIALQTYAMLGMFMASKQDIRDFENAMRAAGLDPNDKVVRRRFHEEITGEGLDFQGMVEAAKDFAKQLLNEKNGDQSGGDDG